MCETRVCDAPVESGHSTPMKKHQVTFMALLYFRRMIHSVAGSWISARYKKRESSVPSEPSASSFPFFL